MFLTSPFKFYKEFLYLLKHMKLAIATIILPVAIIKAVQENADEIRL